MSGVWLTQLLLLATSLLPIASAQTCDRPSAPANGALARGTFSVGRTLAFSCNDGFTLVGSSSTTCTGTPPTATPSTPPTCQDVNECVQLTSPCLNSGVCTNTQGSFQCSCSSGFSGPLCERSCDSDNDCTSSQFCMGSSESIRATVSSSTDVLPSERNTSSLPYIVPTANNPPVTGALTLFGMLRQEPGNNAWVIAKGLDTIRRDYGLYLRGSHDQMWFIFNPLLESKRVSDTQPWRAVTKQDLAIDDNQWHTVAVTFSPTHKRVEFFIDGELRAVEVEDAAPSYSTDVNNIVMVGGRPAGPEFSLKGSLRLARVYSIALTEAQVYEAHQEAMFPTQRYCTNYRAAGQSCHLCATSTSCAQRCSSGLSCIGRGPENTVPVQVPVNGVQYVAPQLAGVCTAPCSTCSLASDSLAVCARNGLSYQNKCFAMCDGQTVLHNGTCASYESLAAQVPGL